MAALKEDFLDLISHETTVDLDRLRGIAFYGVPAEVREAVWLVLVPALSVSSGDGDAAAAAAAGMAMLEKQQEQQQQIQLQLQQEEQQQAHQAARSAATSVGEGEEGIGDGAGTFALGLDDTDTLANFEVTRALKTEMSRYMRRNPAFKSTKMQTKLFNILHDYIARASNAWHIHHSALLHVVAPFAYVFRKETEAATCFQCMIRALDANFGPSNGRKRLGKFLMFFRSRMPDLFVHFEEEDIEPNRWAASWLQWLLCRELPFDCCLRLWDSYFAAPDGHGFELHTFVCLAILETYQADLIELEQGEILVFLNHLPSLDIDRLIVQAQYLAHDFKHQ